MAEVDAQFLATAGLTAARAARILKRSRQTVSRGVGQARGCYFKDGDLAELYQAVLERTPVLAPSVLSFIQAHHAELGTRLKAPGAAQGLPERLAAEQRLARVWVSLPDFQAVKASIWNWITPFFEREGLAIDVFVDNRADYFYFKEAVEGHVCSRNRQRSPGQKMMLWQPNPVVSLAQQVVILEPHLPERTSAYIWDGAGFHPLALESAKRLCSAFINQVIELTPEKVTVRRVALPGGSQAEYEKAAQEWEADVGEARSVAAPEQIQTGVA